MFSQLDSWILVSSLPLLVVADLMQILDLIVWPLGLILVRHSTAFERFHLKVMK